MSNAAPKKSERELLEQFPFTDQNLRILAQVAMESYSEVDLRERMLESFTNTMESSPAAYRAFLRDHHRDLEARMQTIDNRREEAPCGHSACVQYYIDSGERLCVI